MASLTAEQVREQIARFWTTFSAKLADSLEEFYSPQAMVFSSSAVRAEPGRLAATRRRREYFNAATRLRVETGPADILLLGANIAVASYNFDFHASRVSGALGRTMDEDLQHGRATQVFALEDDGKLRIVHEHVSIATPAATR